MAATLREPHLKIVLVEPEIPQNTGNVARLCAVIGAELHLVRPLGFFLGGRHLRRAGLDYLERIELIVHDNLTDLRKRMGGDAYWLTSARAGKSYWDARYGEADWLVFGRETSGLPAFWLREARERAIAIPMRPGERSLNLSTAAGIIAFEVLRQLQYK